MSVQQTTQLSQVDRQILEMIKRVNPNVKAAGFTSFLTIRGAEPRQRNATADNAAAVARKLGVFPHVFVEFLMPSGSVIYPSPHFFPSEDVPVLLVQISCEPKNASCCALLDMLEDFLGIPVPAPQRDALRRNCGLEPVTIVPQKAEEVKREEEPIEEPIPEKLEKERKKEMEKMDVTDIVSPQIQDAVKAVVNTTKEDPDAPIVWDYVVRNFDKLKAFAKENKPLELAPISAPVPPTPQEKPVEKPVEQSQCKELAEKLAELKRLYGRHFDWLFDDEMAYVLGKLADIKEQDEKKFRRVISAFETL
ncbi:MAG: hypothetical protein QXU93_11675 [Thermoproteus sp.]